MKLDIDMMRKILLDAESGEKSPSMDKLCCHEYSFDLGAEDESDAVSYCIHLELLQSAGLIDLENNNLAPTILAGYFRLTFDGHEFLATARNIRDETERKTAFSMSILQELSRRISNSDPVE